MTGPGIYSYSTTPASNVSTNTGINWDEGMPPAAVNNSARQNMTDMRNAFNDLIWFKYGKGDLDYSPVYASGTSFTVAGANVTGVYHAGRRVRAVGSGTGTIYGTISSSSFSTDTTVNVTWDSGSLSNETLTICISQIPVTGFPVSGTAATRQKFGTGTSATYTPPTGCKFIRVRIKGGGGGSAGNGTASMTSGGDGGDTSFAGVVAKGGKGSLITSIGAGGAGGTGGSDNSKTVTRRAGAAGLPACLQLWDSTTYIIIGGTGGGAGGGVAKPSNTAPTSASAAAGSGGGASGPGLGNASQATLTAFTWSGGGGEGEEAVFWLPATTYTYTVGGLGSAGAAGTSGLIGSSGAGGQIDVEEFY